ncbi:zinc carboxypeptidase family protein (macronuclear) [Tetrahymena thermophila SB210]|uniref:Zinc carboxypeptidase family protein n=1 Tax=Tetrahymena thermophila (strain SB210) TaxID=312017 RepID=I7MJB3_TETTS|nr:zinc carboxypeptidase family protein [Tetrahymena thermophila SB210]EAS06119.2 zinc carboxypeptidase family protein [Tetrahymena thermophila SB210]|eukprot:XP_001026364.2 zinc carboxypeptidase family protein [Tetrahymena thermophila SB210]
MIKIAGIFTLIMISYQIVQVISIDQQNQNFNVSTPYTKLDYSDIQQMFIQYSKLYPDYIRLKYINDESSIDFSQTKCGRYLQQKDCLYFYAEITNFKNNQNNYTNIPQVLLTGGLQGNNTLGSNIVTYLAEYLLKNTNSTKIIQLLSERLIILYPIPNPQGFQQYSSQETQQNGRRINVEFDFPYFVGQQGEKTLDCLQSVSAKALTYLFQTYLFTLGASFNLGETPSIQYPLPAAINQQSKEIIQSIQQSITESLQKNSPANSFLSISNYNIQSLNSQNQQAKSYYEWANIMAYNQNLNPSLNQLPICKEVQLSQQSITMQSNQCLLFKIVCNRQEPTEQTYGDKESSSNPYSTNIGHISRNIQLAQQLIEMAAPFIVSQVSINNNNNVYLQWFVDGCFNVSNTQLFYRVQDKLIVQQKVDKYTNIDEISQDFILAKSFINQPGYLIGGQNQYQHSWNFQNETVIDIIITASCDQQWSESGDQQNNSAFIQLRTNPNYSTSNQNFNISSKQTIFKRIPQVQSIQNKMSLCKIYKQIPLSNHSNSLLNRVIIVGFKKLIAPRDFLILDGNLSRPRRLIDNPNNSRNIHKMQRQIH